MEHPTWTQALDELLIELRAAGFKWALIAKRLGKTQEATTSRAGVLSLRGLASRQGTDARPATLANRIIPHDTTPECGPNVSPGVGAYSMDHCEN